MVFSSYGNSSSFYLPLDSDQSVPFYKNENSLFSPQPPSSVVCRRNQDNATSTMSPNEQPFGNNSHGTVVVDAVCHDFQPVAHLSSNGYYGYVPPTPPPKMMSAVAVNAGTVSAVQLDCQPEDAAMDCGEMENFHQLQHQQHQRKRKEYGEEATTATKRRKTWLEEEQQAAAFPQSFGWNQLPYAYQHQQQQMDCATAEVAPMTVGSCNGFQVSPTSPPVAMVQPTVQHQQMTPKNPLLVDGASGKRPLLLGRWNIAMPTTRPNGTGCSAVRQLSEKLHHQQSVSFGGGSGQELEDLFVSLHGSGFFLAG
ncbi:hypothetical protein quinque_006400 [Culex quinquefasciatus]